MSHHHRHHHNDPQHQQRMERIEHRDHRVEHIFRRILHFLERVVASLTILVLVAALVYEVWQGITDISYIADISHYLHNILTIVVGLEFVRMLIDMTPANTLEVLIMATARYVIMNHDSPTALLIGIVCIAILFAVRRFLIPRSDLTLDLVEIE